MADILTQLFMPQQTEVSSLSFSPAASRNQFEPNQSQTFDCGVYYLTYLGSGGSNPLWGNWALAIGPTMLLFVTDEAL